MWRAAALAMLAGAAPAIAKNFLFYGPRYASGSYEVGEASAPGNTITVWSAATWSSKTTADFAAFDAIVFGEGAGSFATAELNANVWSPAVVGRIFIVGTDPNTHNKPQFISEGVEFAASGCGTGLYIILGHSYEGAPPSTTVAVLSGFGNFTARDGGCSDSVFVPLLPPYLGSFTTTNSGYLGGWGCSVHEVLDAIPAGFTDVAIENQYTFAPYLVARDSLGEIVVTMPGPTAVSVGQIFPVPVAVTDPGCGGVTNLSATLAVGSAGGAVTRVAGPVPAFIAALPSGTSTAFVWTYSAAGSGWVVFTGTVTATLGGGATVSLAATSSVLVQTPAMLVGSITAPAQVCAGVPYTVNLTVTNTGEADADGVTATIYPGISGTAPATLNAAPAGALIRGGETRVYAWTFTSTQTGSVSFTLSVSGKDANAAWPVTTGPQTSPGISVVAPAALEAAMAAPALGAVGTLINVTLTVTNTGSLTIPAVTPVIGRLPPAAPVTQTAGPGGPVPLVPGASVTFTWTFSVTGWGQVVFTATANGVDACQNLSATDAAAVLLGTPATLAASALTVLPDPVCAGGVVSVQVSVTNTGDVPANVVTGVPGPLPTGPGTVLPRSSPPALAQLPGKSATVLTWTFTASGAGAVSFTVTVTATDARNGGALTTGLLGPGTATVQSSAILVGAAAAPSGTLLAGTLVTATLTVTNTGGSGATNVLPFDAVSGGGALAVRVSGPTPAGPVALGAGASVTFAWTYSVSGSGVVAVQFSASAAGCGGALPPVTSGTGLLVRRPAVLQIQGLTLAPGTVAGGSTVNAVLVLANTGDLPLTVTAAGSVAGGVLFAASGSPVSPFGIAAGGTTTYTWSHLTRTYCGTGAVSFSAAGTDDIFSLPVSSALSSNTVTVIGSPAGLAVLATPATASAGTPVSLGATLIDSCGFPVPGVTLNFSVLTGGGSVAAASAVTDAAGRTSVAWTLGPLPGGNTARVALPSAGLSNDAAATGALVTLSLAAMPGSGNTGTPVSLRATVTDYQGQPVPNAALAFAVLTGGGSIATLNAMTDAAGQATASWTLGPAPGPNTARVTFSAAGITADAAATGVNPLALPGPGDTGLSANVINPAAGEVAIARFFPINNDPVAVRIFTASGRLVRTLRSQQPMGDGQWKTVWDGKTEDEFPVARGVYLVRVTGGGLNATLKIVVAPH